MELNSVLSMDLKPMDMLDYYCDINLNSLCRVCLEKHQPNKEVCNIFEPCNKPVDISHMLMACASVQVMEGDGLPSTICRNCMTILNVAWQFKLQCENSDIKLRQFCTNQQQLDVTHEVGRYNLDIKEQDSFYTTKSELQNGDSFTQDNSSSEILHTPESQQSSPEVNVEKKSKINKKPPRQKIPKEPKESKVHQCDTCGKTFNRREYLTQHIRIHTGEKPYRCHLCEKRFVNSGHLTTHMRKHTGERPHNCTLCPKAFSTRQELQKHIMVHNGVRPFICKMCNKSFGSSSNLYSHLKHHTGEKNFTCESCGKTFYTKQELKQHLVVHTGEKAFLCEYCNKRFSQIAHLRRHSKLHKT